jgi:hypothetical protein
MIIGVGASQISNVNKEKFSPAPLIAAGGGILQGDSHSQATGGIALSPNILGEGGEMVTNRASTAVYKPLLNSINAAGNSSGNTNEVDDIINYEKLAGLINSQEVVIVDSKIQTSQKEVDIRDSRTGF